MGKAGSVRYFTDGEIVTGTVVGVSGDEVLIDVDDKTEGVIPARELSTRLSDVTIGDLLSAVVTNAEDEEGRLLLSTRRLEKMPDQPTVSSLNRKLTQKRRKLRAVEEQLERAAVEHKAALDDLRAQAQSSRREAQEARSVARRLWTAMPAEGRLAFFESQSSWLPEWVTEHDSPDEPAG